MLKHTKTFELYLDHNGGGMFNLNHIVCACGNCNRNRGNKDLKTHLKNRGIDKTEFDANCDIYFELSKKLI